MRYTHLIWDWNGTLLDDVQLGVEAMNAQLARHELPPLHGVDEYREIFCFPIVDYYRKVGFDFARTPFSELAQEWMDYYQPRSLQCSLMDGAQDCLYSLRKQGISQFVLSASHLEKLCEQIACYPIAEYFDEILGIGDIYAKTKADLALHWVKESGVDAKRLLFVGDTLHDWEVARAVGADCILYTRGHQSRKRLERVGCPLLDDLRKLPSLLEKAQNT